MCDMNDDDLSDQLFDKIRTGSLEEARSALSELRERFAAGSGVAGHYLSMIYCPGGIIVESKDVAAFLSQFESEAECLMLLGQSFPLMLIEADRGSIRAMNFLSIHYQTGLPPVERDMEAMRYWDERCSQEAARRKGQKD